MRKRWAAEEGTFPAAYLHWPISCKQQEFAPHYDVILFISVACDWMGFFFQKQFTKYPARTRRLLEIVLGCVSWALILSPIWGALLIPYALTYFLLAFDSYWLYKSFSLPAFVSLALNKIRRAERENWLEKARGLPNFGRVTHVLIIPNYKERIEKLRATLHAVAAQTFPRERLFIVLAMEAREPDASEKARLLVEEFQHTFGGIWATYHHDVAGEVKGKSSNESFAAKAVYQRLVMGKQVDLLYATISSVDADTIFDRQYFAYLTYAFLTSPRRYHTFWQSANVSYNNFWQVPAPVRVVSYLESLWRMALLLRRDRLLTNSTYSLSFRLLVDVGFWDVDVIPEDYRIFFKAFYLLKGKAWVEPIFLKTSMDAPCAVGYLKSLKSKYDQERRWSWGVSDVPLFIQWWLTVPDVPFWRKTLMLYHLLLDHWLWAVSWFLLTIAVRVIPFVNPIFSATPVGYNLLHLGGIILTPCIFATVLLLVDLRNRPAQPETPKVKHLLLLFEMALLPVAGFFLSTLPGVISHTQLLLGNYLEYRVTEKV